MRQYLLPLIFLLSIILLTFILPQCHHIVLIAGGYSSKSVCSGVFISHRSPRSIEENELKGLTSLLMKSTIDYEKMTVTSSIFGIGEKLSKSLLIPSPTAKFINSNFGCQLILEGKESKSPKSERKSDLLPSITRDLPPITSDLHHELDLNCVKSILDYEFTEAALQQNQTRAVVISHRNELIYENYQGFLNITSSTPLLGWSMTKTVLALLIGAGIKENLLTLDTPLKLSTLTLEHREYLLKRNNNQPLTFRHLLNMNYILQLPEDYGMFGPIVHFLYGTYDISQFINQFNPSDGLPPSPTSPAPTSLSRSSFAWHYSSSVSNLLSFEFRQLFSSDDDYWSFPSRALFSPLNISSFALELDPSGTIIGSSFSYGTGRDWNRLGSLLLSSSNEKILTTEYVNFMKTSFISSGGFYGGHLWMNPNHVSSEIYNLLPADHPRKKQLSWLKNLPNDSVFFSGYHGQYVLIIPSRELVITRLGLTENDESWNHSLFFETITKTCWNKEVMN